MTKSDNIKQINMKDNYKSQGNFFQDNPNKKRLANEDKKYTAVFRAGQNIGGVQERRNLGTTGEGSAGEKGSI